MFVRLVILYCVQCLHIINKYNPFFLPNDINQYTQCPILILGANDVVTDCETETTKLIANNLTFANGIPTYRTRKQKHNKNKPNEK